jgi:UDP-GlcNAc:undecaprenyl-phosphate GlcNAc-1-phosphate transferase
MQSLHALLLLAAAASAALALVLTPVVRRLAIRFGLVDHPDGRRKIHDRPIARIGGVVIAGAYTGAMLLLILLSRRVPALSEVLHTVWSVLPAAIVIFAVGFADDVLGLRPWQKLAGEGVAAALAISAGVHMTSIAGFSFHPVAGGVITFIWLIGCANAINLIDGVDGLASGIALLAAATMLVAALLNGQIGLAIATLPLAGALLGFLRYNFNPASIFLGDCGSLTLGFLLGCYGVLWSEKSATILGITAPLMALAVPLLDTSLSIFRRFLRQQPIFGADRSHIHHRLLSRGLKPRRVALLLYAAAGGAGVLSLLLSQLRGHWEGVVVVMFAAFAVVGIQQLGYAEFGTARRLVLAGAFRRLLNAHISLEAFSSEIERASSPDEYWHVIRSSYTAFGFSHAEMCLGNFRYLDRTGPRGATTSWRMQIPLDGVGYIRLERLDNSPGPSTLSASFADALYSILNRKLHSQSVARQPDERPRAVARAAGSSY